MFSRRKEGCLAGLLQYVVLEEEPPFVRNTGRRDMPQKKVTKQERKRCPRGKQSEGHALTSESDIAQTRAGQNKKEAQARKREHGKRRGRDAETRDRGQGPKHPPKAAR